jgi:hypothetical protein
MLVSWTVKAFVFDVNDFELKGFGRVGALHGYPFVFDAVDFDLKGFGRVGALHGWRRLDFSMLSLRQATYLYTINYPK